MIGKAQGSMSLTEFVRAASGKTQSELEPDEHAALVTIYGWGAGPDNLREYMKANELESYAAVVRFVERRVP